MVYKELLPLGSVVSLKEAEQDLLIFGILQVNSEDKKVYDYISCPFPSGNLGADKYYLFNHEDIEKVQFYGYVNAEHQEFRKALKEGLNKENIENAKMRR